MEQVHGTCVAIDGLGVLLLGRSGSGKSDLALRLIDAGAELVSDDYTEVSLDPKGEVIGARPPPTIAGRIEVRGIGVMRMHHRTYAPVMLAVELVDGGQIERLPEPEVRMFLGHPVPLLRLAPFETSAPAKVRVALRLAHGEIRLDGDIDPLAVGARNE